MKRYEVHTIHRYHQATAESEPLHETFLMLGISEEVENTNQDLSCADNDFTKLLKCKWRYSGKRQNTKDEQNICKGDRDAVSSTEITLHMKQFIMDNDLIYEKQGYDKNINLLKIDAEDVRFKQAADIAQICKRLQVRQAYIHLSLRID